MVQEIREENLGTGIWYFPNSFYIMTRAGKAAEFSPCGRTFICQLKLAENKFPSSWRGSGRWPPAGLPWKLWPKSSRASFLSVTRGRGDVETCPLHLQLANEHSLTRWEFTCLASPGHHVRKNLESVKCPFLNFPFLFHTPYSNKYY